MIICMPGLGSLLYAGNAAFIKALAQIVLQATLHTICVIFHPILLFGTIRLLGSV